MRTPADVRVAPPHHRGHRSSQRWLFSTLVTTALVVLLVAWAVRTYDRLAEADQEVRARWTQLQTTAQRRLELVPDLVALSRWVEAFEPTVLSEVAAARAHVVQLTPGELRRVLDDPSVFVRFQGGHERLGVALGRLTSTAQSHPSLGATPAFRQLRAQLEVTEDRLAVERLRYNEAARTFNATRTEFPAMFVARAFRDRFQEKALFQLAPGASTPR